MISAFLSHSSKDKETAGYLKRALRDFRIDVFVAHDDIEGGEEWMNRILAKLNECNTFLALLSKEYHRAQYTDQETGIVLGLGRPVIPISIDGTLPYGFMSKFQSMNATAGFEEYNVCYDIAKRIYHKTAAENKPTDLFIEALSKSISYDQANNLARLLFEEADFSVIQLNKIILAFVENHELRGGFTSSREIKRLIEKRRNDISLELQKKLES